VTARFANRQCKEYAKLGLLGTTVLYSSGDWGVAGGGGKCVGANGKRRHSQFPSKCPIAVQLLIGQRVENSGRFNPSFPATCPYVTAVGATQVNPGSTVFEPESACEQVIFSGGGFSDIFSIPDYQKRAVRDYLEDHPPPYTADQYNNSGNVWMSP